MRYVTFCVTVQQVKFEGKMVSALKKALRQEGTARRVLNRSIGERARHIHADLYRCQEGVPIVDGQEAR